MKRLFIFITYSFFAFCIACTLQNNESDQADRAKYEFYRLTNSLNCNCDCTYDEGVVVNKKLINLSVKLDKRVYEGDSVVVYYFYYWDDTLKKRLKVKFDYNNDCMDEVAVGFKIHDTTPFIGYVGDKGVINYEEPNRRGTRDSIFINCIKKSENANTWLKKYLNKTK